MYNHGWWESERQHMRYIIGFFITIGLLILLIVLLLSGGGSPKKTSQKKLEDYAATNAQVRVTIDGPVNAASLHEQVRITVDNSNVTFEHIKGYDGDVVDTQVFANTENSYDVFLHALRHAGFSRGNNTASLRDEKGYCPTGDRYIFELIQDDNDIQRYWSTSCGGIKTYLGATGLTLQLFRLQVPNYQKATSKINL